MTKEVTPPPTQSYVPLAETLAYRGWQAVNWLTVISATSLAVALVQSPLNSLMMNFIKHGKAIPPSVQIYSGKLAIVHGLYAGLGANFAGSSARTAYVASVKKNNFLENDEQASLENGADKAEVMAASHTPSKDFFRDVGYVALISLGDVLVTQLPETKAQLIKAQVIDSGFNTRTFHNVYKMGALGFYARFSGGMINFSALCIVEEFYANLLPGDNYRANHFISGAASGMTAALFSYPCSYYRDYLISKTSVTDGKLQAPSTLNLASSALTHIKTVGLGATLQQVASEFAVQAPLRLGRTSATFALVSGIGHLLGEEPLAFALSKRSDFICSWNRFRFFTQLGATEQNIEFKAQEREQAKP